MLTELEAKKWVSRFEKLLPKGWTVSHEADVFTIERNDPVQMINEINRPPAADSEAPARVARALGRELGWDERQIAEEVERFAAEADAEGIVVNG